MAQLIGFLTTFLLLVACGGAPAAVDRKAPPKPKPVDVRGTDSVQAEVKELGGVLRLANGAVLRFAPETVEGSLFVSFSAGGDTLALRANEEQRPLGPMLKIGPEVQFAEGKLPSLAIRADVLPEGFVAEDLALGMEFLEEHQYDLRGQQPTRWRYYPARQEEGWLIADLEQFTGLRVHFMVRK